MKNKISAVFILLSLYALTFFTACGGGSSDSPTSSDWLYEIPKTGAGAIGGYTLNSKEDGTLQEGADWPSPRFTLNGDSASVTDNLTGLIWVRDCNLMYTRRAGQDLNFDQDGTNNDGLVTWQHALDYVAKLNTEKYLGHNDWRLPNINELNTMVNLGEENQNWLQTSGQFQQVGFIYWSSTTYAPDTTFAVGMSFLNGYMWPCAKTEFYLVTAVRGGISSPKVPKTGQTTTYSPKDDGDLEVGYAWPDPRFTDNLDGTMTDNLTGLMWQKTVNGTARTWAASINFASDQMTGSHLDWRLPNRSELLSICNYGQANNAAWLIARGFNDVVTGSSFWSSTTYYSPATQAWPVAITGIPQDSAKTNSTSYSWAVRGER